MDFSCRRRGKVALLVAFMMIPLILLKFANFQLVHRSWLDEPECEDRKPNILYLKTHKSGSSTLFNIFMRKAEKDGKFVGLSKRGVYFHYGTKFDGSMVKPAPEGKDINILASHMVFNHGQVKRILGPNTVYVTIIRDPASQFDSSFHYYHHAVKSFKRVNESLGVAEYVKSPAKYFRGKEPGSWWFGKNGVMYDFGLNNLSENESYIDEEIQKLDRIFDLVLINEYYDMGLLLLKQMLCWDIEDLIYFSFNVRTKPTSVSFDPRVVKNIYEWNNGDTKLYRHFNKTFWIKIHAYGKERMERDLRLLHNLKDQARNYCMEGTVANNDNKDRRFKIGHHVGADTFTYKLKSAAKNNKTCLSYLLPEGAWHGKFLRVQYPPPPPKAAHSLSSKQKNEKANADHQ